MKVFFHRACDEGTVLVISVMVVKVIVAVIVMQVPPPISISRV